MLKNIHHAHLKELFTKEPEAELVVETLLENHKRILATLSHEIRNPLTLLYGNMQLLQVKHPQLVQDPLWISALEDFSYTHELLDQLSLYNNSNSLTMKPTNINEFFSDIADTFQHSLDDNHALFTWQVPEYGECIIDKIKIKQVMINLLKNAKEATTKGDSIHLSVDKIADSVLVKITDSGCGIKKDHLENIFSPFVTHKEHGTGLGLSICQEIIMAHDGDLWAESTINEGTCFSISLPIG